MILSYLKIEFKVIMRKKTTLILSILFPVIFYILFTSILELPEDVKPKFYKEYMYSMTVYSLLSFSLLTFPLVKSRLLCKMLYNVFTISTYQN